MWMCNHQGTRFQIWKGQHTWFWFVADTCCDGAAIGAAANELDAVCEARRSIEEMASRRSGNGEARRISKPGLPAPGKCDRANPGDFAPGEFAWNALLANLERYLTRLCDQCV